MVTAQQIKEYLKTVPPLPEALRSALDALGRGELAEAAKAAAADQAMIYYLKQVVNSAAYGFRHELNDAAQIFSALGVQRAKQLLYAYMVSVMAPKSWRFFKLEKEEFTRFQVDFLKKWEALVHAAEADEKFLSAAAVMSAGLVVADAIFAERREDVELLTSAESLDLDTILRKVAGMGFMELVDTIAKLWEVDDEVRITVRYAFGREACDTSEVSCKLGALLHLLLFYELSRPALMEAGANGFIAFNPAFAQSVMPLFSSVVEMA